ncbi:unnamed protein product, partial [Mesorhabditis belari]|uniref:RRM domain-containing protein n=1 Tax=Mesorhabditis belari TaxID=2138241 RepID=A0AAF3EBQ5_9BILA
MDEEDILLGSSLDNEVLDTEIDESILLDTLENNKEDNVLFSEDASPRKETKEEFVGASIKEQAHKDDAFELDYEEDDETEERVDRFEPERPEHKTLYKTKEESSSQSNDNVETIFKVRIQPNHLRAGFPDGANFGWKVTAALQGQPTNAGSGSPMKVSLISGLARIPGMGIPPPNFGAPPPNMPGKWAVDSSRAIKPGSYPPASKNKPPSLLKMNIAEPIVLPGKKILVNPKFSQGGISVPPPMLNVPPPALNISVPSSNLFEKQPPAMGQWDAQVAAFLASSSGKTRKRRSRSRSESSESYDRSSDSNSGRSRSRSHSKDRRNNLGTTRSRPQRGDRTNWNRSRGHTHRAVTEDTLESAKALGLDQEYLRKVEEQKRRREETLKRKHNSSSNVKSEPPRKISPSSMQHGDEQKNKLRAYLVVRIVNLSALGGFALKKVTQLAKEHAEVKKCWQDDADVVSVIFSEHDKAKTFMLKHNSKVWSGVRVSVNLEKIYLNLTNT